MFLGVGSLMVLGMAVAGLRDYSTLQTGAAVVGIVVDVIAVRLIVRGRRTGSWSPLLIACGACLACLVLMALAGRV
ncbi:hypothetical protein ACIBL6_46225 [Streptomyces sp. NPDC050400]|uniref:hypothetical protein n=1 Tax=Streptomyces sp. NPDC050400 TaxID=3365610 RepID=UPI0037924A57